MNSLSTTIEEVRAIVARAGEADRLNWWPSKVYSSGAKILERLFPKTDSRAAYAIICHAARQKDGTFEQQESLLSLFYLGGKREALLGHDNATPPGELLQTAFRDGAELSEALLSHYADALGGLVPTSSEASEVNQVQKRVDVMTVESADMREADLKRVMALLIAGLRHSTKNNYLPPVVRIHERTP
ncbi:MAG: BrxE family protein [Trueperaceae bacterium]|nr:BrxE family protein [Trueperaceae bacterium]